MYVISPVEIENRKLGKPRTDEERRERHERLYGTRELPQRGTGLGDFGEILTMGSVLAGGQPATFTFQKGGFFSFDFTSDTTILQGLRERMANYGDIIKVYRPFFSNRWIVTVVPSASVTVSQWWDAFDTSWKDMDYSDISLLQVEGGAVSTEPVGLPQVVHEVVPSVSESVGTAVSNIVSPIVKPLLPYVLIFGGIYLLFKVGIPEYTKTRVKVGARRRKSEGLYYRKRY